jgi:hypothetical protein
MCDWGLVDPTSSVNIHRIYDFIGGLAALCSRRILTLILSSWCEQEAPIGGKGQSPKERSKSLICV